jgi:hypothetical protein
MILTSVQVDTQFPLNPGVQQPGVVMMGPGHGMGMADEATATSGGKAPMNRMIPALSARLKLEQIRAQDFQQKTTVQQNLMVTGGYPCKVFAGYMR